MDITLNMFNECILNELTSHAAQHGESVEMQHSSFKHFSRLHGQCSLQLTRITLSLSHSLLSLHLPHYTCLPTVPLPLPHQRPHLPRSHRDPTATAYLPCESEVLSSSVSLACSSSRPSAPRMHKPR
jgi:hypothetical protein